ncbi:hypothetical protein [Sphingopyxis sp. JAI128]|uniref:hypothetical protein n=1 Tax=Sphingopyxis sp. JAI128 TaxID=2723066 RepID=UPI001621567A|nr:hypothetical protein [Sphingopyxis sp. JAI128]MBB6428026.1 hypothetical protein [Sphingopyxis sp. JAI128]
MKLLFILIAVAGLTGCAPQPVLESEKAAQDRAKKRAKDVELWASYERQRLALTHDRQGCQGYVLRDQELKNAIVGKRMKPPVEHIPLDGATAARTYSANGELLRHGWQGIPIIAKYWIDGDKLCFENADGRGCSRLIVTPNGDLNEEILDDRDPKAFRLVCAPMVLEKVETAR